VRPGIIFFLAAVAAVAQQLPKSVNDGYGDFLLVPAGAFTMGDTTGEGLDRERPVHTVTLDAFYIGKHEITNADWKKFQNDPGYEDKKFWPNGWVVPKDQSPYWHQANNHGGGTPGSDNYPVLGVNWDAATAYCNWLSAKTGKKYRLPTEAEWEKAARGTDKRKFPWGNQISHEYANYVGKPATFSSGVRTGISGITTRIRRRRIRKGRPRAPTACCAAARSSLKRATCAFRPAAAAGLRSRPGV
jgi:formylglycine-generating enzyme required for sulfatase activity